MSGTNFRAVGNDAAIGADRVTQAATSAGAAIRDAADQARDVASDINKRVSRQADQAVQDLSRRVEDQPMMALLIAGGIGLLAGLILARR